MAPVGGLASHYFPREAPYVRMIYSIDEIHGGVGGYAPPVAPILPLPSLHPRFPTRYPRPIRSLPQSKPALYKHSKTHLSPATLPSTLYQRLLVPLSATTRAYRAWFTILTHSPSYHRYCTAAKTLFQITSYKRQRSLSFPTRPKMLNHCLPPPPICHPFHPHCFGFPFITRSSRTADILLPRSLSVSS